MDSSSAISSPKIFPALHVPTGSIVPHLLLWICQIFALFCPPFSGRATISAVAIGFLAIFSQIRPHFTNDIALAQPFTIGWSVCLSTLEKILFSSSPGPEADLWHIDKPAREALSFPEFGLQKLKWALVVMFNMRGIRWNFQVKNVPQPKQRLNRRRFLARQLLNLIYYFVAADVVVQLGIRLFYTAADGESSILDSKDLTLLHPDWRWSFTKALVFGASPYYICSLQYTLFSIPAVLLGFSKPEDWPPIFGSLGSATTVRAFWGQYWHQTIRKVGIYSSLFTPLYVGRRPCVFWQVSRPLTYKQLLTAYNTFLLSLFSIPRGTILSKYLQIWFAFTLSGLMHANSMRGLPLPNINTADCTLVMLRFFLWQALAITLGDLAISIYQQPFRRKGLEAFWRMIGWAWVIVSFWISMHWAGDVMLRMRLGEETFLPGTVSKGWIKEWVPVPR
ncbi:thioredoxin reductase gliT [Physcia stellaris]|nr:thioredoxin reductase gliT [Physcia stellaris]